MHVHFSWVGLETGRWMCTGQKNTMIHLATKASLTSLFWTTTRLYQSCGHSITRILSKNCVVPHGTLMHTCHLSALWFYNAIYCNADLSSYTYREEISTEHIVGTITQKERFQCFISGSGLNMMSTSSSSIIDYLKFLVPSIFASPRLSMPPIRHLPLSFTTGVDEEMNLSLY